MTTMQTHHSAHGRQVLDGELKWGHAVWCANLDGDADEELVIGIRDNMNEKFKSNLGVWEVPGLFLSGVVDRHLELLSRK